MSAESASAQATGRRRHRRRIAMLWAGVLGPPVAWSVQLVAGDAVTELGCRRGLGSAAVIASVVVLTLVTAACAVAAGVVAWRQRPGDEDDVGGERTAFLSTLGTASAVIFSVLILGGGLIPRLFLQTCGG
jgi:hypothetical protein